MFPFLKNGHTTSCGVPEVACTCPRLYVVTGLLGILAGVVQLVFGILFDGGLALTSDGTHAGADGMADFLAALIAVGILCNPRLAETLEIAGRKIIALALAGSALWVIAEATGRASGTHIVVPLLLAVGGALGACMDAYRLFLLRKAQAVEKNSMRAGLIAHAQSDFYRSVIAAGIGAALVAGGTAISAAWFETAVVYADLALSTGLSVYMFVLAKGIWRGEHSHGHGECRHDHYHHHH